MTYRTSIWQYRSPLKPEELMHYASPYYDPIKAHEYYMRTRVLKGRPRKSTEVKEDDKRLAIATKERIKDEKSRERDVLTRKASNDVGSSKDAIQREIATLRAKYLGMSKEERAKNKKGIQREIERLRRLIRREKTRINSRLGRDISNVEEEYATRQANAVESVQRKSSSSSKSNQTSSRKTESAKKEAPRASGGGGKRTLMTK